MKIDFSTISVWLAALAPLLSLALALALDRRKRKRIEKPPQDKKLLRPPGHSLAIRLDETVDAVLFDILIACGVSACAGVFAVLFVQFLAAHVSALWLISSGSLLALFAAAGVLAAIRAFGRLREAQNIRLGLRGEQAVAETLHEVADCGFRAFHDFPGGEDWNIDHIAVGTRGVFLIETKARRRRGSLNGQKEHEVTYDEQALHFPTGTDRNAIPQARRNAKWLSNYLTGKTGEPVQVTPILVLPGWYVYPVDKRNFAIKAMNATYLAGHMRRQEHSIEPAQVRRIITALDEKCRDVEF